MHARTAPSMVQLPKAVLDHLMPMHLSVDALGQITHGGATIIKMMQWTGFDTPDLFQMIEMRRPAGISDMTALMRHAGTRLSLVLKSAPDLPLRAVILPDHNNGGAIMDISLGLSFARAVANFSLTLNDFSPCDQTVEMLYLNEANTSTARLSRHLSERLQAAHASAQTQARTDALTGLANRRAMDGELQRLLSDRRHEFTLLHIDLDHFKETNDTLGHAAGDAVLMEIGRILSKDLRRYDFPARIGGDEFLIILRPNLRTNAAEAVADRLIELIEQPVWYENAACHVSASIGIVDTSQYLERPTAVQLMADADAALYKAKRLGRGRHVSHIVAA